MIFVLPDDFYLLKWLYYTIAKYFGEEEGRRLIYQLFEERKIIGKEEKINVEEIFDRRIGL